MRRFVPLIAGLALVASVSVACAREAPKSETRWVITDLGTLPGTERSDARAINARGEVVGVSYTGREVEHAFLWRNGRMMALGTMVSLTTSTLAINDHGQVVWTSYTNGGSHAFLWQKGKLRDLGALGGEESDAVAINERGQVVGWSGGLWATEPHGTIVLIEHASLWQNGEPRDLGTLGGEVSEAVAINERGQVVGWSEIKAKDPYGTQLRHAFLWQKGEMINLGTLPGEDGKGHPWTESFASEISVRGEIVGTCRSSSHARHAFLWRNGTMTDLDPGTLGGQTEPRDINERGQIVGWRVTAHGRTHAFLWEKRKMTDLGTLGPQTPRSEAVAINDSGQVVGTSEGGSRLRSRDARAFIWENGKMTDLGTLPGTKESEAVAINNRGQIVGWSGADIYNAHAVLWTLKRR